MAAIAYNAPHSNSRKSFEIGPSTKFLSKFLSPKSYQHAMLDLIAILLCLWLQAPVICPKSKKVDAVDKQPPSMDSTVDYKIPTYPVGQRSLDSRHTHQGPPRKGANHCLKRTTNGQSLAVGQFRHFDSSGKADIARGIVTAQRS